MIRSTQGPIWRFCRHSLGNDDDAADATQETYIRALRSLKSFRGESALLTWLLTIARRVCSVRIKEIVRRRERETALVDVAGEEPDGWLQWALDELSPPLREAIVLTQIVGLSYEEAAVAAGCPIGTIRSRVARARQQLVKAYRDD